MIQIDVSQAAATFDVSEKTIRQWIREDGMPVTESGDRGPGNGATLDLVRAIDWWRRRNSLPVMSDAFAACSMPANPLRWLVEMFADSFPSMIATAAKGWFCDRTWENAGLTEKQARLVVWQLSGWMLVMAHEHKTNAFESRLKAISGGDLDDLAGVFFGGLVYSTWNPGSDIPESLMEFAPATFRTASTRRS